jgi:hypothetical protein
VLCGYIYAEWGVLLTGLKHFSRLSPEFQIVFPGKKELPDFPLGIAGKNSGEKRNFRFFPERNQNNYFFTKSSIFQFVLPSFVDIN